MTDIKQKYDNDGYVFPITVLNQDQIDALLDDFEQAEREVDADNKKVLFGYPHRLLPAFDELICHPVILDNVRQVLGDDLIVWGASIFDKPANSDKIVSWHQDLTYWDLNQADEVTAWVALTPATSASGCMKFVPGSHKQQQVDHHDTFAENNLLTRGQELAVEVDETQAVAIELQPGQASIHHGHLFHASGPNKTNRRRAGLAIRYIKPSMKQSGGARATVRLVSGRDTHGHFELARSPAGRLSREQITHCKAETALRESFLYAGAKR